MSIVLQISDPHFGTEREPVVTALVNLCHGLQPDLVVLSGDITQRARADQFEAASRFLDRLSPPASLVIPGNHDLPLYNLWQRLVAPYGNYRRCFGHELEPVHDHGDLLVVGVNSTRPARQQDGEISPDQVARVAARLKQRRVGQLAVVVAHHPLHVTGDGDRKNLVHGHAHAIATWVEAGADLMLGGHIHLPFIRPATHVIAGLGREAWVVQAGTAVSDRVRSHVPNSVNVIHYHEQAGARDCRVDRWDYVEESANFARVQQTTLMRSDTTIKTGLE